MKNLLPNLGWVLFGLLIISGVLISAGRQETSTSPKVESYYPSGTSALAELLRRNGYQVSADRRPNPKLSSGDVALAFQLPSPVAFPSLGGASVEMPKDPTEKVVKSLAASVKKGAVVMWLPLSDGFAEASQEAKSPISWKRLDGEERKLSGVGPSDPIDGDVALLSSNATNFIAASKSEAGYNIRYADAIGLTNRFLDKADNARAFVETLKTFAKPDSRVVFTEATFGNVREPGLLETIGPWAENSWYQLLFLLLVIVFTLNRRFGLPEESRPPQRGARELLDAIADTLTRARASGMTLRTAADAADWELRNVLKLPRDASPGERDRLLPEKLNLAFARVRAASEMPNIPPSHALELVQSLERELNLFLSERRQGRPTRNVKAQAKLRRAA